MVQRLGANRGRPGEQTRPSMTIHGQPNCAAGSMPCEHLAERSRSGPIRIASARLRRTAPRHAIEQRFGEDQQRDEHQAAHVHGVVLQQRLAVSCQRTWPVASAQTAIGSQ